MITPYNVLRHEIIGLKTKIVMPGHLGYTVSGVITQESRQTITLKNPKGEKKIPKSQAKIELELDEGTKIKVDGKLLIGRPVDRLKKKIRIKY